MQDISERDVHLVFIGLHGKFAEDGRIQRLLDMLNIPYVGSDVLSSALAMDKQQAKRVFKTNGIPVAKSNIYYVTKQINKQHLVAQIKAEFTPPFVIKPNRERSTLGITIIENQDRKSVV